MEIPSGRYGAILFPQLREVMDILYITRFDPLYLYLQRLWERLSQLPAVFTDGEALDEKVYPWLISGMVRSHVRLLKEHRPALSRIQTGISILLAWWVVPFTFFLLWIRYVPRHDWVGTSLHVGVLAVSITAALFLHRLAAKTLRGEKTSSLSWKEKVKSLPAYQHASLRLGILGLCFLTFWMLSTWAIEGVRPRDDLDKPLAEGSLYEWDDGPILLPRLFDYVGYRTYANLEEEDISTKPPTWTGQELNLPNEIPLVKGAKLRRANLQHAYMVRAFLINADLRDAKLQQAVLNVANLQQADLRNAKLQQAVLNVANLQQADLTGADLTEARLIDADLSYAVLREARLTRANLQQANLRAANLTDVKNLTQAQLNEACLDEATKLPKDLKRPKPCPAEELSKD